MSDLKELVNSQTSGAERKAAIDYLMQFFSHDFEPEKCTKCGASDFSYKIEDAEVFIVLEESVSCNSCGEKLSYWAHGYYSPDFALGQIERFLEKTVASEVAQ